MRIRKPAVYTTGFYLETKFDFKKVFLLDEIRFTDGNLATNPTIYKNVNGLENLDFNLIYHRTWFTPEDRNKIINARHSEILVKNKLKLENNLRLIAVRSEAEKETFLNQLSKTLQKKYQSKIYVQPQTGIFINEWLYVDKVSLIENKINIQWNMCLNKINCKDKYILKIVASNEKLTILKQLKKENWYPQSNPQKINLTEELQNIQFNLKIYIDDIKVYDSYLGDNK